MKHNRFAALVAASSWAALFTSPFAILAEDAAIGTLDTYVISATRVEMPKSRVGNAITQITHDQIEARQFMEFEDVIRSAPGVITAANGQRGSITSVFLRGTTGDQTQIVVDGIRINNSTLDSRFFLGGATAHHLDSVEILRGPQSALYGGEAIGGVIALNTARATGAPHASWKTSAGSFNSLATEFNAQIAEGAAAWSLSLGRELTDNSRIHNAFDQFYYAGRFDVDLTSQLSAGFTTRGSHQTLESPGPVYWHDFDNEEESEFSLWTAWLDASLTDGWNSRLTYGAVDQRYIRRTPPFQTVDDYQKDTLDWRNVLSWNEDLTTVFGVNWETTRLNGFVQERDSLLAAYGQQTAQLFDRLTLTGGGRWEEYDSFGSVWTWRGTGAYQVKATDTILRASYGTGFRAPSFRELYYYDPPIPAWWYPGFVGNPSLQPETSRGWDAGVEQPLFGSTTIAATWFANDLEDLIQTDFLAAPWTTANVAQAHTQGLEVELNGSLRDRLFWGVAYTYLEAENETANTRLLRCPEHAVSFDLRTLWLDDRLTLGFGGYAIQNRTDNDGQFGGTIDGDDYFVARAYAAFEVTESLELQARLENAFDEEYDELHGYPGRPQGIFGGVKLSF